MSFFSNFLTFFKDTPHGARRKGRKVIASNKKTDTRLKESYYYTKKMTLANKSAIFMYF
jgi:hypothetical protein